MHREGLVALLRNAFGYKARFVRTIDSMNVTYEDASDIVDDIQVLGESLIEAEALWATQIGRVHPEYLASARNLVHYWAVRQHDLRGLQQRLARLGLSSLGRSEPHVQATLAAIANAAAAVTGRPVQTGDPPVGFDDAGRLLRHRTRAVFGAQPDGRRTRIMVTLPPHAATDPSFVRALVEYGMNVARINCAHDNPAQWTAMIDNVRRASASTGRDCQIMMDLAGPKLRTGPLPDGPQVLKLRPARDVTGHVTAPARCWIGPAAGHARPEGEVAVLRVPAAWLAALRPGDTVEFVDARGSDRHLLVGATLDGGVLATTGRTAYLMTGTVLRHPDGRTATVAPLPPTQQFLVLRRGDLLTLTRDCAPTTAMIGAQRIGCTLPEAFGSIEADSVIHLDDGKFSGRVVEAGNDEIRIEITSAPVNGGRLRAGKGINLPGTLLPVSAVTDSDRADLGFVAAHADLVALSFARTASDVEDLLDALAERGDDRLGVIVKVETAQGFENLPEILLAAMRRPKAAVMIARGDLAAECGYERMAELQEEILWLCEAAHLPVIWATQVLDQLARSGRPSRAEITDAAMGQRAECVMLNKGPFILDAVITLDDILRRMSAHHYKKNALMRPLRSWTATLADTEDL